MASRQTVDDIARSFVFERHPDPMWVFHLDDLHIVAANEAASAKYHYRRDDLLSMRISDLRPAEDQTWLRRYLDVDLQAGKNRTEARHRTLEGDILDVEVSLVPFAEGNRRLALASIHDVSEYKAEIRRLRSEGWIPWSSLMPTPVAIVSKDDLRFLYANARTHSLLEMARAELHERSLLDLVTEPSVRKIIRAQLKRNEAVTGVRATLKVGRDRHRRVSLGMNSVHFLGRPALAIVLHDEPEAGA